jgi:hypothetical protein
LLKEWKTKSLVMAVSKDLKLNLQLKQKRKTGKFMEDTGSGMVTLMKETKKCGLILLSS